MLRASNVLQLSVRVLNLFNCRVDEKNISKRNCYKMAELRPRRFDTNFCWTGNNTTISLAERKRLHPFSSSPHNDYTDFKFLSGRLRGLNSAQTLADIHLNQEEHGPADK